MYSKSGCVKAKDMKRVKRKNRAKMPRDKRLTKQMHNDFNIKTL